MTVVKNYYKNADLHSSAKYIKTKNKEKNKNNLHYFFSLYPRPRPSRGVLLQPGTKMGGEGGWWWGCEMGGESPKKRRQCCPSTINQPLHHKYSVHLLRFISALCCFLFLLLRQICFTNASTGCRSGEFFTFFFIMIVVRAEVKESSWWRRKRERRLGLETKRWRIFSIIMVWLISTWFKWIVL